MDLDTGHRVPVLDGDDAEANRLARLIAPIGTVGGDANLNGTDALLSEKRERNN